MVQFDIMVHVEKFCRVQGNTTYLPQTTKWTFSIVFSFTGVCILAASLYVVYRGTIQSRVLRRSSSIYILSLIVTDLCFGGIFIPLLITELIMSISKTDEQNCDLRAFRVLTFDYFFLTRLMSVFFISFNTYVKTCQQLTWLDQFIDRVSVRVVSLCLIWVATLLALVIVVMTSIHANADLGIVAYVFYFIIVGVIVVFYVRSFRSIRESNQRSRSIWTLQALTYFNGIIVWFIVISTLLTVGGLLLLLIAHTEHQGKTHLYLQDGIYVVVLLICTLDAIANPLVYMWRFLNIWSCCRSMQHKNKTGDEEERRPLIDDNDDQNEESSEDDDNHQSQSMAKNYGAT